jgi:hypothetical protein
MYLDFKKFCLQEDSSAVAFMGPETDGSIVYQSWHTPSFQVAILSRERAAQIYEPKSNLKPSPTIIKKGDEVEVFDMNKKKNIHGKFITGIKDPEGNYKTVTLNVDGKIIKLETSEIEKA